MVTCQIWSHVTMLLLFRLVIFCQSELVSELGQHQPKAVKKKMAPFPVSAALHFIPVTSRFGLRGKDVRQSLFQCTERSQSQRGNQQQFSSNSRQKKFSHGRKDFTNSKQ